MADSSERAAVTNRIDAHLDAIDGVLSACGMSRAERHQITEDVEAQIIQMLHERVGDAENATLADVEEVLTQLDSPDAFADMVERVDGEEQSTIDPAESQSPRLSRAALAGAVWLVFGLLALAVTGLMWFRPVEVNDHSMRTGPAWWEVGFTCLIGFPACSRLWAQRFSVWWQSA